MNELTVAEYLARSLAARGVTHCFELIGGMITLLVDAVHRESNITVISMHHEQGAGFAAEGFARMSGIPAVALATSGPGATNLLTAIGSCYFDSVPSLFITGQVNRHEMRGSRNIRQLGFQETDIVSMARPITKSAVQVIDPAAFPEILESAFRTACEGRPGPVLIDIPMDVQKTQIPPAELVFSTSENASPSSEAGFRNELVEHLRSAARPLFLVGGGLRSGNAVNEFRALVDRWKIPTIFSLMGVDVLPWSHEMRVGLIGSYGNRWANRALAAADTLIVLGSRLDIRQTGADTQSFKGARRIFHVDCEEGELNNRVEGCDVLVAELRDFLIGLAAGAGENFAFPDWSAEIAEWRGASPDTAENAVDGCINPNALIHELSRVFPDASAFVTDVGQHQMWAAQSAELNDRQRFLTSGGMGSMGFGLPAAVGAAFATPGKPVVLIAGDGGFQCNIQELQTIVRHGLPVKIFVLNNRCHGMVRQFQQSYFQGRFHSTVWGYSTPSFARVAEGYGIPAAVVSSPAEVGGAFRAAAANPLEPFLLEVDIASETNAYPKMAFGRAFGEMEPDVKPMEMEGT